MSLTDDMYTNDEITFSTVQKLDEPEPMYPAEVPKVDHPGMRPMVVCICGSTRHWEVQAYVAMQETLKGRIVLPVGNYRYSDGDLKIDDESDLKKALLALHRHKMEMADQIVIVKPKHRKLGQHTESELRFAIALKKKIHVVEFAPTKWNDFPTEWSEKPQPGKVVELHPGEKTKKEKSIREARERIYGKPSITLECLALHLTALLRSQLQRSDVEVSPKTAGMLMACLKVHRIVAPFESPSDDNFRDLKNYVDFVEELEA